MEKDTSNVKPLGTETLETNVEGDYNKVSYYNLYSVEAREMARRIWGTETLIKAAEIIAFFYRMRAGLKENNSPDVEYAKEKNWLEWRDEISKLL